MAAGRLRRQGGAANWARRWGLVLLALTASAAQAEQRVQQTGPGIFRFPAIADAVTAPDGTTLIASAPDETKLYYLDSTAGPGVSVLRDIPLKFKPGAMAVQGDRLFVATVGATTIHVLTLATGEETGTFEAANPVVGLACHRAQGPLFAAHKVFEGLTVIDPATGKSEAHPAAPAKFRNPSEQRYPTLVAADPSGAPQVFSMPGGSRSTPVTRYRVEGLKLTKIDEVEAGTNGLGLSVSHDGKRVATACGAGYRPGGHGGYDLGVFDAGGLGTGAQVVRFDSYPAGVAFHPHLDLLVAFRDGNPMGVYVFDSTTWTQRAAAPVKESSLSTGALMLFGNHGRRLVYISRGQDPKSILQVFNLPITVEEDAALSKIYPEPKVEAPAE